MFTRRIAITKYDKMRLLWMIADELDKESAGECPQLDQLLAELKRSVLVPTQRVRPEVVTMNSRPVIRDLVTGQSATYTLVFPQEADPEANKLSILSPIGTAVLGHACGDTIKWAGPGGKLKLRIEALEYQPEAAGDFDM